MASVNKVILVGNLGADPELRYTSSGQPVCNMRLATNRKYKDRDGNLQEDVNWTHVTTWGKQGESCKEYLHKGSQVYVEGRLKRDKYNDKQGEVRYRTEVVSYQVLFLGRPGNGQTALASAGDPAGDPAPAVSASSDEMPF